MKYEIYGLLKKYRHLYFKSGKELTFQEIQLKTLYQQHSKYINPDTKLMMLLNQV